MITVPCTASNQVNSWWRWKQRHIPCRSGSAALRFAPFPYSPQTKELFLYLRYVWSIVLWSKLACDFRAQYQRRCAVIWRDPPTPADLSHPSLGSREPVAVAVAVAVA